MATSQLRSFRVIETAEDRSLKNYCYLHIIWIFGFLSYWFSTEPDTIDLRLDIHVCEGVSNIITLLRFPGSAFSGTSILGQWGEICFAEFLEIISSFFAQIFCTDRVDILLCSERKKTGGFSSKFGTLAPSKYCGRRRQARARLRPRRVFARSIVGGRYF